MGGGMGGRMGGGWRRGFLAAAEQTWIAVLQITPDAVIVACIFRILDSGWSIHRSWIYCSPSLVTVATSDKLKFVFDIQRGKTPIVKNLQMSVL